MSETKKFVVFKPKFAKKTVKLSLIAKPEIPENIIAEKARQLRKDRIYEDRKRDLIEKMKRNLEEIISGGDKKKSKKDKKGKKDDKGSKKDKGSTKGKGSKKEKPSKGDKASKKSKGSEKKSEKSSKSDKTKKGKDRKSKSGSKDEEAIKDLKEKTLSELEKTLPEIKIRESEIIITPFDLYPAEMVLWREFAPYVMETLFTIKVYRQDSRRKNFEQFYLTAVCKATMPDFVHNLNTQHIDFGPTAIGDTKREVLKIKNIKDFAIKPRLEKLSTVGIFTCPSVLSVQVPSEHVLSLPITFNATENYTNVVEFFEIKSGSTNCPLVLSGSCVDARLVFKPDFLVCRLESAGEYTDFPIEILNPSQTSVKLTFEKIFELHGEIKECPKKDDANESPVETKDKKSKKSGGKNKKDKKSDGKSEKSSSKKSDKKSKKSDKKSKKSAKLKGKEKCLITSQELTEDEVYSIGNFFERKTVLEKNLFDVIDGKTIEIPAGSRKIIKLRFGIGPIESEDQNLSKRNKKGGKIDKDKKGKNHKDKKGKKDDKKSKKSSKSSKDSKKKQKKGKSVKDPNIYLAKFNILIGTSSFLKDFIVFGKFV